MVVRSLRGTSIGCVRMRAMFRLRNCRRVIGVRRRRRNELMECLAYGRSSCHGGASKAVRLNQ